MKDFQKYLLDSGFSRATISQYIRSVEVFHKWASGLDKNIADFKYQEMVLFIDDTMRSIYYSNNLTKIINRIMIALTYYYDYLITMNMNINNPAKSIRIKDPHRSIIHNLLSKSELVSLYETIVVKDDRDVRNKVILGFLIFQALSVSELHRLSMSDLILRKGTILVKGDNKGSYRKGSTYRELDLEALQIIDMIDYIDNVRPRILVNCYRHSPGRKPSQENAVFRTDQLLLSLFGSPNIKNTLHHMFIQLKKSNPRVKSAIQIRQSVIAHWVEKYNLRKAQYMAGHRYVSSTEYYKRVNINDLRREVCEYHPLG